MRTLCLLTFLSVCTLSSCLEELEAETPRLETFTIYELIDDGSGQLVRGGEVTQTTAGQDVQIDVITGANLATLWPGDFSYRPWGQTDSILDSRAFIHYGQLGAAGIPMSQLEGAVGFTLQYAWPEAGSYDIAVVLTNHGVDGPEYKQEDFGGFSINITE